MARHARHSTASSSLHRLAITGAPDGLASTAQSAACRLRDSCRELRATSFGRNLSSAANATVNLRDNGTMYVDREYRVDLRVARILNLRSTWTALSVDLFNMLNASNVQATTRASRAGCSGNAFCRRGLRSFGVKLDF
jgi:hypothetical protein